MIVKPLYSYVSKRYLLHWLYALGVIILLGSGWLWLARVQVQPERVFWGAIEQSLRTRGVTVQALQGSEQDVAVKTSLQLGLGGNNLAQSRTEVIQADSRVVTEVLGTLDQDYTRYAAIETTQKNKQGQPLDTSKLTGVWAKNDGEGRLLAETLLGLNQQFGALPIPIGYVSPKARAELIEKIRSEKMYTVDFQNITKSTSKDSGRAIITYPVTIQVIQYVDLMKRFAKAVGLPNLNDVDPNAYSGAQPFELLISIDARSQQVQSVQHKQQTEGLTQTYSGYDVPVRTEVPAQTIPISEWQARLRELR